MASSGFDAGQLEKSGREVDVEHHVGVAAAGLNGSRIAHKQRHAQRLLVHEALVVPAVVAEEEALVGGVDHDGVFGQALLIEPAQQAADVVVDTGDDAQVVLDVALVGPAAQLGLGQVVGNFSLDVAVAHVHADAHLGCGRGGGALAVVVLQRVGLRHHFVQEQMRVFFVRLPGAVRRLVVAHQHEGPLAVEAIQPVQAHVGDDVRHVAGHDALLTAVRAVKNEGRVVIEALAGQDGPVVEAGRAVLRPAAQVPLAEDAGLPATGPAAF